LVLDSLPPDPLTAGDELLEMCELEGAIDRAAARQARERLRHDGTLVVKTVPRDDSVQRCLMAEGFTSIRRRGRTVTARRGDGKPPLSRPQLLSVILPAYNEAETFPKVMDRLLAKRVAGVDIEVVVVESNSSDGTRASALQYEHEAGVKLVLEDAPRGKGHAVRAGLEVAQGDIVLIQDADLEYDMNDYDALVEPVRNCDATFVLGVRGRHAKSWGARHYGKSPFLTNLMNVGHVIFLALFNAVYQQRLRDPFTMYKVFRRECISGLSFECDRFDFDWELAAKLIRAGYRPREIPVSYHSRSFSEGKKVSVLRDPWTWVVACFKYRFARLYNDAF
jgi:glycosyltransferase involved in cell wall biosynthesis